MEAYAVKHQCRRRQILDYFGESTPITNCRCDICSRSVVPRWQSASPAYVRPVPKPKAARQRVAKADILDTPLDASASVRFERLKKVRRELADEQQWPAFCIMHDRTLKEVARRSPKSIRELALIKGIGEKKAVHFGPALLKALQD